MARGKMNTIERRSVRGGPAVEQLLAAACQAFHLRDIGVLRGNSRVRAISQARCYVASVLRGEGFAFSTPEIGKVLGGKDPSTVFYYLKAHPRLLTDDAHSRRVREAEEIRERLSRETSELPIEPVAIEWSPR